MALFSLERLSFAYGSHAVLGEVTFDLDAGGIVALLGPNGSGKTTLLKLMLGLLRPSHGTIRLDGRDIRDIPQRELACSVAYVPQVHKESFAYLVSDVVLMGRMPHTRLFSAYGAHDRRIAREAMEKLGIEHLAGRPYTEVSGGERQLTLIARAMAQGARTFVMDEPTNGLDYGNQVCLLERLSSLSQEGCTFIFSTHHPDHALAVASRVIMLHRGTVLRDGPAERAICGESLQELYGIEVRMAAVGGGVTVCVPAIRRT
ncbi:ABC transporter ATP-binding protein [Geobacter sp. SVR]|uniref:ABC transporter ATP-binding protein n=1 Tax=Geobacter sp. SVR TaxID=2495594 RepID=UPI00143F01B6|nr:ABC transporter ATP-binding protein [Geobacter sp. SVR]BCS55060.1 iron(III) ABC transporter ATP-binding protein [Geobacter sp. SVR]GCF85242.1 iron(III) ABC transporter ATP-binding protein [Geobacter sp. SVR]